ncbi:MAG: glycogen debranching enzyme N-terminal domain-containing protein [Candidatus Obscuribacter sp.]|nr:glycogen debranching enzyme N-terminal domain-containing protein [Candidatus Obscuribacter sp.]
MLAFAAAPVPTFCYQLPEGRLIKRVLMKDGEQHVYIGYSYVSDLAESEISLDLSVLLNYRDFHSQTRGSDDWHFSQEKQAPGSVKITAFNGAEPFFLSSSKGEYQVDSSWYRDYFLPREYERGWRQRRLSENRSLPGEAQGWRVFYHCCRSLALVGSAVHSGTGKAGGCPPTQSPGEGGCSG